MKRVSNPDPPAHARKPPPPPDPPKVVRSIALALFVCSGLTLSGCAHPEALLTPQTVEAVATIAITPAVTPATVQAGAVLFNAIVQAAKR